MNWLKKLIDKVASKDETNVEKEFERKIRANDWIGPVMDENEDALVEQAENEQFDIEEVKATRITTEDAESLNDINWERKPSSWDEIPMADLTPEQEAVVNRLDVVDLSDGSEMASPVENFPTAPPSQYFLMKRPEGAYLVDTQGYDYPRYVVRVASKKSTTAAYEKGDTPEDTIEKDYELRVKSLSDYNLAEMLLEYDLHDKGLATTVQVEAKDKMKKYVENNRSEAENKLIKQLGTHSKLDLKKAFEKYKENEEVKHPSEEDLRKPELQTGKQNWEKSSDYKTPSDKEKLEQMEGIGNEEEKGQVGKEASDVTDTIRKKVVKKIKDVIEEELDDKVVMEKEDAVEEHERLTDVLESPSHEDDKEEAVEQKEELEEYKEAKVTHSDTCERCKELYPSVCEVCKKDKANEIGDYRKEAKEDECARCEHPKSQHNEDGQCDKCLPTGNEHRFVKAQEIKPKVTKEAALKAIADAGDIWKVVENEKGEKLIAKVKKPMASNKESKDDENKDFLSGNKI